MTEFSTRKVNLLIDNEASISKLPLEYYRELQMKRAVNLTRIPQVKSYREYLKVIYRRYLKAPQSRKFLRGLGFDRGTSLDNILLDEIFALPSPKKEHLLVSYFMGIANPKLNTPARKEPQTALIN